MIPTLNSSRRQFLQQTAALAAAATLAPGLAMADPSVPDALAGRLYKTLKIGMIKGNGLVERFKIAKAAGFKGVEMNFPGDNVEETKKAIAESGLVVDGSVCGDHWSVRHTSPDAAVRAKALASLKQALRDTRDVGGHSTLLVVGKGEDGPEQEIWKRSVENIAQAVPLAAELGVQIVIENVWNQFLYDHNGDAKQTADKFARSVKPRNRLVDQIEHLRVGVDLQPAQDRAVVFGRVEAEGAIAGDMDDLARVMPLSHREVMHCVGFPTSPRPSTRPI